MKQRRIKKLVKGHLNAKDVDGQDVYADKKVRLAALEQMNSATLLDTLIGAGAGKGDGDAAAFADDFAPFDAREQVDTDGDGIGDNRDILLNKIASDVIFVKTINGAAQPANAGTLEVAAAKLVTVAADIAAIADGVLSGDDQRAALLVLQGDVDYTEDGINALLATVRAGRTEYLALKGNVDAMTATAGVTIDVAVPYNNAGDSAHTAADMATDAALIGEEGVSGRANDAKVAADAAIEDLGEIAVEP